MKFATPFGTANVAIAGTLILAMALVPGPAFAHCKGPHEGTDGCQSHDHDSGGSGGRNNGNLEATFCLNLVSDSFAQLSMESDDGSYKGYHYCDDRDQRVSIMTGKGPGFNFETYNRNGGSWVRWVVFNCTGDIAVKDDFGGLLNPFRCGQPYKMTFRFDKDNGGLDLGSLTWDKGASDMGAVSIFAGLEAADGSRWMIAHGSVDAPGTSGHLADNPCVKADYPAGSGSDETADLLVTREDEDSWKFEHSGDACLWDQTSGLEFQAGTRVDLDYTFWIDIEP